jgi:hypothetical protein
MVLAIVIGFVIFASLLPQLVMTGVLILLGAGIIMFALYADFDEKLTATFAIFGVGLVLLAFIAPNFFFTLVGRTAFVVEGTPAELAAIAGANCWQSGSALKLNGVVKNVNDEVVGSINNVTIACVSDTRAEYVTNNVKICGRVSSMITGQESENKCSAGSPTVFDAGNLLAPPSTPDCPNGICESTESIGTCYADCQSQSYCGDLFCDYDGGETNTDCLEDCFTCGDNLCNPLNENYDTCPDDCEAPTTSVCGNGVCETGESGFNCSQDCGILPPPPSPSPECNTAIDCEGKPHIACVGEWSCTNNACEWVCEEQPAPDYTQGYYIVIALLGIIIAATVALVLLWRQ